MTYRARVLALLVVVSLSVAGCSATADTDAESTSAGGLIELAVSEVCTEASDPECVAVTGEYVVRPAAFQKAAVEHAEVSGGQQQNAVDVTFTADGARVFHALTDQAAQGGGEARLVVKIGDQMRAAVRVIEAPTGDEVTIALSPDNDARHIVALISSP